MEARGLRVITKRRSRADYKVRVLTLQGYLAHKKMHLFRTLPLAYDLGPRVVLEGGGFLMSEVPL